MYDENSADAEPPRRQRPETALALQPRTGGARAAARPTTAAAAAPSECVSPEAAGSTRPKQARADALADCKQSLPSRAAVKAAEADAAEEKAAPASGAKRASSAGLSLERRPRRHQDKRAVDRTIADRPQEHTPPVRAASGASTSEHSTTSEPGPRSTPVGDTIAEAEATSDAVATSSTLDSQKQTLKETSLPDATGESATLQDTPNSTEKLANQTPGHLRRSKRFKTLTPAKLAERSWDGKELEQREVLTDEKVEDMMLSFVDIFRAGLPEVEPSQLAAALQYYGIDYRALELNGLLLALDAEVSARCNHVQGGVDGQLLQILLRIFPVESENGIDHEALQRFEYALNLFAGMRGWKEPTRLRSCCFEEKQPLQLIPVTDSRRLNLLRLSDKDRHFFALASSSKPSPGLEKWLADVMEATYVLLYGFLQSRRNSGSKALAKLDHLHTRQERIQAAVQKISAFNFDVWKRLEFRTTDVEDVLMVKRLNELVKRVLSDAHVYLREVDGSIFFPVIIGYLTKKSEQLSQSLSALLMSTRGSHGALHKTVQEYLRSLHQQLEQHKLHSAPPDMYLSNIGLKIVDVDKINASRSISGLGRIYLDGRESILTHHQCELMARDTKLRVRGRWEQQELRKAEVSSGADETCWEDYEGFTKTEAQHAFEFFCSASLQVAMNVAVGIGINIIHSDLLPHLSSLLSLNLVLREYSDATSVSFGYCYDPVTQTTRITFRVHTVVSPVKPNYDNESRAWWELPNAIRRVGQFLASAQDEEIIAFCKTEGLRFLFSIFEKRCLPWHLIKVGQPFGDYINKKCQWGPECEHDDALRAIQNTITAFPRAPQSITKENILIVIELLEKLPDLSDVADVVANVLQALCSKNDEPKMAVDFFPTAMTEAQVAIVMNSVPSLLCANAHVDCLLQKIFTRQSALELLVNASTRFQSRPKRKEAVECAIVSLLMGYDLSASKSGLLNHWVEYLEFYVTNKAWMKYPGTPAFSVFLLKQIHANFFSVSSFREPESEACPCGCDRYWVSVTDACVGVMMIFLKLMITDACLPWAQDEMQGPRDCVLFLSWSAQPNHWTPTMTELHDLLFSSLCKFLEHMTSPHQYLRALTEMTPPLLDLLRHNENSSLSTGALRVLSFTFRLAVDKKVWLISMESFLAAFYQILESLYPDPLPSSINDVMVDVLVHSQYRQYCCSTRILCLLHEEHINFAGGSGQLSPVARSCTKSLVQTLVSFCSLSWNSALQPACQIPALISLGWLLANLDIACDLAQLDLDEVLLALVESDNATVSIFASRAYILSMFQALLSRRTIDDHRSRRLCNVLTTILASGSRPMLSPKRASNPENTESIEFVTNAQDSYSIILRYQAINHEQQTRSHQKDFDQDDVPFEEHSPDKIIWDSNEWNDPNRAIAEKLELASGIIWGLAEAYEKFSQLLLSFEVDDGLATGFTRKLGFAVMVDNLSSKLAIGRTVENDAGALASMIANQVGGSFFISNYGYSFILKLIESMLRLIRADHMIDTKAVESADMASELFGPLLFYSYPIKHLLERGLFQLCRAAANVLESMQQVSPESILDEAARTKLTMLPLLDFPNKQIAHFAVLCCSTHLQTHPTKCTKLLETDIQDKLIAFFFDDNYPPIQIAAFSCMKLAFADQKNLAGIQVKISPLTERIVSCLLEAIYRLDDHMFLNVVAEAFSSQCNNGLLMDLFESVSREISVNPPAVNVLQLLVRLILKLNLIVHTGGDHLNELRNVAGMLFSVASNHTGIRHYLSGFTSQCIPKLVGIMDGLSEHIKSGEPPQILNDRTQLEGVNSDENDRKISPSQVADERNVDYFLRVTTVKAVYISHFIEDIYEQRISCSAFDTALMISAKGSPATNIWRLSIQVLERLAACHQSRGQLIRGSAKLDWSWISHLTRYAVLPDFCPDDAEAPTSWSVMESSAAHTIQVLGHLSAAKALDSGAACDRIMLANELILTRNRVLLTPGLQGRSVDDDVILLLVSQLLSNEVDTYDVRCICADVLSHLLYFRVNAQDDKRLRSVLWRYTRVMTSYKTAEPSNHPSSKRLTAYLHNWLEPMLQKLRQSSFGTFQDDSAQLLHDELAFTCKHLDEPSISELVRVLVDIHLHPQHSENSDPIPTTTFVESTDVDIIPPYTYGNLYSSRPRYLQYIFRGSDRSSRETNDHSFRGSGHLWDFLKRLWELANAGEASTDKTRTIICGVKDIVAASIPRIITTWSEEGNVRYSAVAFERRKAYLDFIIAVGKVEPSIFSGVDVESIVDVVAGNSPNSGATMGREYLLLYHVCSHSPTKLTSIMRSLHIGQGDGHEHTPSERFRLFWSRVQLNSLPVKFVLHPNTRVTILDPSSDVDLTTIFGIDLLRLLSSNTPYVGLLYVRCQGYTQLLDMLLLGVNVSALQMQQLFVRSFLSNLLYLVSQLVEVDNLKYIRIFASDPRYLRCVVDFIYAPAHEVQTGAIKLLQKLAQNPRLFAILSRLENVAQPLATVHTDAISYVTEIILTKHQASPPLAQDCVVLLAHLLFVPFFTGLSTTELVKLSLGFSRCKEYAQNCWLVLLNDWRYSAIPDWMLEPSTYSAVSLSSAMKRIQKRFDSTLAVHRDKSNLSLYLIDKDSYFSHTSVVTRKRIAMKLNTLLKTYTDENKMYRGSVRARNGLVMRLGRLLVEDRAEIIRRVAYRKRTSERVLYEQMRAHQLSDILLLLEENPLFEGIQRDLLANLAFHIRSPIEILVDEFSSSQRLPLLLLYNESVEFEMYIPQAQQVLRGKVLRGGLMGCPSWVYSTPMNDSTGIFTSVHACGLYGAVIPIEVLKSEFPASDLELVNERLQQSYGAGNIQAISLLMGLNTVPALKWGKHRLQRSAVSLIVQLISLDVFMDSLLNDKWAMEVIVDVALGALSAAVVLDALTVIAAMTANNAYTKQFCAKLMVSGSDHEKANESTSYSVANIVNRFKLRLWQNYPEILEKFFLIQTQLARYLLGFWTSLEVIWSQKYLAGCMALLGTVSKDTSEIVSHHLSSAIPYRDDFLVQCGFNLGLHLALAQLLTREHHGDIVGLLRLFDTLCANESLHEEMWERVVNNSEKFNGVLQHVVSAIDACFETGHTKDLKVYCGFLYHLCMSRVDEKLDLEFGLSMQSRFGILTKLLVGLSGPPGENVTSVILRCIGALCVDTPSNRNIAVACVVASKEQQTYFISAVVKALTDLDTSLAANNAVDVSAIEGIFLCVKSITSAKPFEIEARQIVSVGIRVVQLLTFHSQDLANKSVAALQSVIDALVCGFDCDNRHYTETVGEFAMSTLLACYERISYTFSSTNNNLPQLKLLGKFTILLNAVLSYHQCCDLVWATHFSKTELSHSFITWLYHWICFESALEDSFGGSKRYRFHAAAVNLKDISLEVMIRLGKHDSISEALNLHPKFAELVAYIFTQLHSEQLESNISRATSRMYLLCVVAEQWSEDTRLERWENDQKCLNTVVAILQNVSIPTLVKACRSVDKTNDAFKCYIIRFLFLTVKLRTYFANFLDGLLRCTDDWSELFPVSIDVLTSSAPSILTKCYMMGLLTELVIAEDSFASLIETTTQLVELVQFVLKMYDDKSNRLDIDFSEATTSVITNDFLSSRKNCSVDIMDVTAGSDTTFRFGLCRESLRFIYHLLKLADARKALFDATFFHPLMRTTVFRDAISILSVRGITKLWLRAQADALQLIRSVMDTEAEEIPSQIIRSYQFVARRGQIVKHCTNLLSKPHPSHLQRMVVEALIAYVSQNICASREVVSMRERGDGDLMEILLTITTQEGQQYDRDVKQLCLRLYSLIIEFSSANAVYATLNFIVRLLVGPAQNINQLLVEECWEVVASVLLHRMFAPNLNTVKHSLELLCNVLVKTELLVKVLHDWEGRGNQVALRLVNMIHYEFSLGDEATVTPIFNIAKLSIKATIQLCKSDRLCEYLSSYLNVDYVLSIDNVHELYKYRAQIIKILIFHEITTNRTPRLVAQLLHKYNDILVLTRNHRLQLLELLPSLIDSSTFQVKDFCDDLWSCILDELEPTTNNMDALTTALEALVAILTVCDTAKASSDILFDLRKVLMRMLCDFNKSYNSHRILASNLLDLGNGENLLNYTSKHGILILSSLFMLCGSEDESTSFMEQHCEQFFSWWMDSSVCRRGNSSDDDDNKLFLKSLILQFVDVRVKLNPQTRVVDFAPYWRVLTRAFVNFQGMEVHYKLSTMLLQMLQSASSSKYRFFIDSIYNLNLIDVLRCKVSTVSQDIKFGKSELRVLWYELLNELCCNHDSALNIMEKRFVDEFILLEKKSHFDDDMIQQAGERLLRLIASVIRATNTLDHEHIFAKQITSLGDLVELCIRAIGSFANMCETKWNAADILYALTMHEQALLIVRKVFDLHPIERLNFYSISRQNRLRDISDMLLQCDQDVSGLARVLALVLKLCGSKQSISWMTIARNVPGCWPMIDLLVEVIQKCSGNATSSAMHTKKYLRHIVLTTNSPDDFLPYKLPTELHTQATVLALELVRICIDDPNFAKSLEADMELVPQLVTMLALSNWEVSGSAAAILCSLIRCTPNLSSSESRIANVTRYSYGQGFYRYLDYFSKIDVQIACRLSPPSMFPSCFVLLVRWLRFYSVNLSLLSDFRCVEFGGPKEPYPLMLLTKSLETRSRDFHVNFVNDVLELLLYILANFHSEIYKSDNGATEESEHKTFLQSLLALCQRRSQSIPDRFSCEDSDTCVIPNSQIRSRSLELVQLMCSLDLPRASSVQVFTSSHQMLILMMIVERSSSDIEQIAATQLIEELALKDEIRKLLICDASLLFRLGKWLETDKLELLAAVIFQRLAKPPNKGCRSSEKSVFGFSPSVQQQLAHFLFVGIQKQRKLDDLRPASKQSWKSPLQLRSVRKICVVVTQQEDNCQSNTTDSFVSVHLKFELLLQSGLSSRTFEYETTLQSRKNLSRHEFLADQSINAIRCTMIIYMHNSAGGSSSTETKFEFVYGFGCCVHGSGTVILKVSEKPVDESIVSPSAQGVLSNLLRQEAKPLSLQLFEALSSIVVEFCKDFVIFCDPVVGLSRQVLTVLATSVAFSSRRIMDVACLEAMCTWFPTTPTIATLNSSVYPLLQLIQSLRQLSCICGDIGGTKQIFPQTSYSPISVSSNFLEKLAELIASVDAGYFSANCLNTLFIENADLLIYLCAQFSPNQPPQITFLALVAIAVRREILHCQAFNTQNAQDLLRSVFDAGASQCQSEQQRVELLSFAASVAVRLARCPGDSRNSVNETTNLCFFSRIAYEVFAKHNWDDRFPNDATEDLILACGFYCDGFPKWVAVDTDTRDELSCSALFTTFNDMEDGLTIVETLLMFLGSNRNSNGQLFDSMDRLAASILSSLAEKLPSRAKFEETVLQILEFRSRRNNNSESEAINSSMRHFEEQCLAGMRKCIALTRYDFQSELHVLQLTYYSCIRAGVRTGVIPPQCSGVLQRFDQEHLLPTESEEWHIDQMGLVDQMYRQHSHLWRSSDENPMTLSTKNLTAEDTRLDSELRELVLYANEHAELLSVLAVNRKKSMTTAIRVATRNARVLIAFHAMTSIVLDFYVDTARKVLQVYQNEGRDCGEKYPAYLAKPRAVSLEIAHQFRSLIVDLPLFLRKIQRSGTHSRQQALLLFLDNLHRLLKRATNRNELRVVAANGSSIVDQTKGIRARLRNLDAPVSEALGALLESPHGIENLSRSLVAMQYMWRRIMGTSTLEKAMTSSKESSSLLEKIKEKLMVFIQILQRPVKAFLARDEIYQESCSTEQFDTPSVVPITPSANDSVNTDGSQSSNGRDFVVMPGKSFDVLLSRFPFTSSELALDHFGFECIGAKRTKQLLVSPKQKSTATEVLALACGISQETVERMSVLELAGCFHQLEGEKKLFDILDQLRQLPLDDELPFMHLPCVVHDKMEVSLWRLMVRPIQRVRLFHLYQQMQRFLQSDYTKRQAILSTYRQGSPQRPAPENVSPGKIGYEAENRMESVAKFQDSSACTRFYKTLRSEQRVVAERPVSELPSLPAPSDGSSASPAAPKVVIYQSTLRVCDGIFNADPFSDDAAMTFLRRKLDAQKRRQRSMGAATFRNLQAKSDRSARYRKDPHESFANSVLRWAVSIGARLFLLVAFWRNEELRIDLQDPIMARAFDDSRERDEYYRLYHAKKGLGELVRVWMPTSGKLGLPLWQERYYALGGSVLSLAIALWIPNLIFHGSVNIPDASSRNSIMTWIVYTYGITIFLLSVISIVLIARKLIQLNSLAFDTAVDWDDTDQLPAILQWLGNQGITKFGITSASELQALGVLMLLLSWFFLLKCANKFQETSALLHRVLTKDLPTFIHGFLYMGTISVFFSYLACIDCSGRHSSGFKKCKSDPLALPFLIAHQNISCWTSEHRWYALLGIWGITFFLPIGLLAYGMSHVLFQRETLDIKYAPVLMLVAQLVKAVAAMAQAFFPYDPMFLAVLGVIGNGALLVLTLAMHSCSLWYIKYVKCSIYAASCWASLGAIHRLHYVGQSSTRSLNMIYFGWLSIGLVAATGILLRVWLRVQSKYRDAERQFAAQQRLLGAGKSTGEIGGAEQKFLKAAKKHSRDGLALAAFVENAKKLSTSSPPAALKAFVARAKEPPGSRSAKDNVFGAQFTRSAQTMAKKLRDHENLRRRRGGLKGDDIHVGVVADNRARILSTTFYILGRVWLGTSSRGRQLREPGVQPPAEVREDLVSLRVLEDAVEDAVEDLERLVLVGQPVVELPRHALVGDVVLRAHEEEYLERAEAAARLQDALVLGEAVHGAERLLHGPGGDVALGGERVGLEVRERARVAPQQLVVHARHEPHARQHERERLDEGGLHLPERRHLHAHGGARPEGGGELVPPREHDVQPHERAEGRARDDERRRRVAREREDGALGEGHEHVRVLHELAEAAHVAARLVAVAVAAAVVHQVVRDHAEAALAQALTAMNTPKDSQSPTYSSYAVLVPPSLQHLEGCFANARNQQLFYFALFPPENRPLHGVVLFLHGSGDHCRRYVFLYEHLCETGYGVIAYDMVNHGASHCDSPKARGHVRSFRHLVEDTNTFVTFAMQSIFPKVKALRHASAIGSCSSESSKIYTPPLIISGTSFGALLGMHTVLSGCHEFQAAFWGGATVGMEMSTAWKLQATVIQALSLLVPKVRLVASLDYEMLWRDPGCLEDFKADALATTEDITARTMQQTLSAMNKLMRDKRIEQPDSGFCRLRMLFLSGSEDHIADQGVTRQFFSRLANIDKEFEVFDGVFHCVFEDPERDEVVAYLLRWLRR
ncbi:unnamed protein product [Phytophthora fragariaefolia]|uniref:Unnamed protein product n=1 Tax=Phytophthora fragariaefolia TaxID=1490495 RepID=A0A9W7CS07_9STRA|nr:unnamed protein product [Phytophthora fragariaefolia]